MAELAQDFFRIIRERRLPALSLWIEKSFAAGVALSMNHTTWRGEARRGGRRSLGRELVVGGCHVLVAYSGRCLPDR